MGASQVALVMKNLLAKAGEGQKMSVGFLDWEDPLR